MEYKIKLHKEKRYRQWLINTLLDVDPFAEFSICSFPDGYRRALSMDDIPERIVFEKGNGETITNALKDMNLEVRELLFYGKASSFSLRINDMVDLFEWLKRIIDDATERAITETKLRWSHFCTFSFVDHEGCKITVKSPNEHSGFWRNDPRYIGKYTDDCFLIYKQKIMNLTKDV